MTKNNDSGKFSTLVAIDIALRRNEVLIQRPGRKRYRMSMTNDRADHDRLVRHLQNIGGDVDIALEATGNYHRTLAWRMIRAGFNMHLISSVALARIREALHNTWDKNDAKDAQVILHMLSAGNVQRYYDPLVHGINDWQELSKTHAVISKMKTEVLHRLKTHYLPLYFPEIDRFRNNSRVEGFFRFLYHFPTPAAITRLDQAEFIAASWDLLGRKVSKKTLFIRHLRDGMRVDRVTGANRVRRGRHVPPGHYADAPTHSASRGHRSRNTATRRRPRGLSAPTTDSRHWADPCADDSR